MDFVKSHGLGNDYIVVDPAKLPFELTPAAIALICDRHFGVGSDGILALAPSQEADFGLRIFNPDGSEAEKSGNGLRIFSKFVYDYGLTSKTSFTVDTLGGIVRSSLVVEDGRVKAVEVDMGRAEFSDIVSLDVGGQTFPVTVLSVGNPHCVLIVDDFERLDWQALGPRIENHPLFPNRTNVQFVRILSRSDVEVRIWERGAGETLASGSSACAAAAACYRQGLVGPSVRVHMEGGDLVVAMDSSGEIQMSGPVEEVYSGDFSPELITKIKSL